MILAEINCWYNLNTLYVFQWLFVVYVVCPFGVFFSCFHICIIPLVCFSSVFTFALSLWCVFFTMCFNVGSARRNYFHETVYGFHGLKMVIMVFSFNFKKLEKWNVFDSKWKLNNGFFSSNGSKMVLTVVAFTFT